MGAVNVLKAAVIKAPVYTRRGLQERLFTLAFSGLVYPQIWEDPEVDIEAMEPLEGKRIVTIASGGCNVLAYLTERPNAVITVDLNRHHVALNRLKHAAIGHLPDFETFFRFFGEADRADNIVAYDRHLADRLDPETRSYWDQLTWTGRRISLFKRNIYKYGLLGRFITVLHILARLHRVDPRRMLEARTMEDQRRIFDEHLAPVFSSWLVRTLCRSPSSLYGLGIPPAQFDDLKSTAAGGDMAMLLKHRLGRLACDFPLDDNYFAWQAFGRGYDREHRKAVPRYLQERHFETLRQTVDRVDISQASITARLADEPAASMDRYVLLDAQDWMDTRQMNELWAQIGRTARPGAKVIYRTAGEQTILPNHLPAALLDRWRYDETASRALHQRDRSSIYGGFHIYTLIDA
ncbi:putative S-adenosylmethionine:diacylglycerol 3-amino-3-carboxypropyl transferase [alpha proteobacterium BAL199]|jgi:S-adenosylmethionine-diacylglycerol 3-amino-3-carboxypropyl transferase|nr:putative S-adenosylmethionine:diacylglycerol 3-amino-3-carboxypropyl transferase [alpha proteobacterium BAL199]